MTRKVGVETVSVHLPILTLRRLRRIAKAALTTPEQVAQVLIALMLEAAQQKEEERKP